MRRGAYRHGRFSIFDYHDMSIGAGRVTIGNSHSYNKEDIKMNDVTFLILKCVLSIAVALITAYLIPYIKSKTSTETQNMVADVVSVAVKAAEQTMEQGKVKKEAVMDYVMNWLALHNVKMSSAQVDQLIECIVYELKREKS